MKPEIKSYCESIGLTAPFLKRIEEFHEIITEMIKEEPVEVFIEEYVNEEGVRIYTDASFFSERYYIAINEFLTNDRIFLHNLKVKVESILITKQDYDFKKATEKSRLNLEVRYAAQVIGHYKASKENCDFLWKVVCKYFIPFMEIK